ncbi:S8 family serine peptidase [Kordiimonas aquimaris]|uniref:S8 family serine peptidase n=1 Tax=Kordiimonas aquimaris TaxID=707591 RepID=UPI0021D2CE79|nr:S8 family serine peptidase [Kordiimonas aquimaris]
MQLQSICAGLITLLTITGCSQQLPIASSSSELLAVNQNVTDDTNVIVLVSSNQAANRLMINAARRGYQLNSKTGLSSLNLIMLDFERPIGVNGTIAINDMKTMEPSATAELDHHYTIQAEENMPSPRQYASTMINWPEHGCSAKVNIGMIDGLVDQKTERLRSAMITTRDFTNSKPLVSAHGTAIADLLVGPGRLKDAHLYSASVIGAGSKNNSSAGVSEVIEAVDWLLSSNVMLVNISLAGPYNAALDRVVKGAAAQGMIIVAAVGNDGPNALPRYPAAFEDVIAVTAIDSAHAVFAAAGRGHHVDFSAPGVDVFVDDGQSPRYLSGTSVSAPFVTALIASDSKLATLDAVDSVRSRMASRATDLGASGRDPVFGAGLVRVHEQCTVKS